MVDVAKKHGVSEQTIYAWRKRFGTMTASDTKRLRALEQENGRLRSWWERDLELEVMKEIAAKMYGPPPPCKRGQPIHDTACANVSGLELGLRAPRATMGIRARRSSKMVRLRRPHFWSGFPARRLCGSFISLIASRKRLGGQFQTYVVVTETGRYASPWASTAQAMRASLLASATIATWRCTRDWSRVSQVSN